MFFSVSQVQSLEQPVTIHIWENWEPGYSYCFKSTVSFNKITLTIAYFCSQCHRFLCNLHLKGKISVGCTGSSDEEREVNINVAAKKCHCIQKVLTST